VLLLFIIVDLRICSQGRRHFNNYMARYLVHARVV
jgi:hypothetical protein